MRTQVPGRIGGRGDAAAVRHQFERDAIWSRMVAPGDRLPAVPVVEVDLGPIHLDRMRQTGPVVLVFFHHATSAPCLAALRRYATTLAPALDDLGAHLLAVSPQERGRLESLKFRLGADMFVTSDPRHTLIDALNIGFTSPAAAGVLGTGRTVLPFPAVVVADRRGVVRLVDVSAERTPAATITQAVRTIQGGPSRTGGLSRIR
ncbi:peroxiredoxin [Krasilnikovia cinnamomea]|uniref:Peroxiredoxin n=1 Tax=Krasilnikovia cinnamomea TaxID=349313 RepID=A0A4Q7ZT25_9ACTN|nr:redoxin domain-containing protein [Krasilnikovia cinnamomea]RZU54370.1 peroxiredoxin [Krasilnikovia cinnamomea]